ncbi:TetR/AcrR family transcriptional regulator [Streptomyces poriticola]|uniref:TetR/AcrR family transcriptional regulator n=1 Tax=Streptomyces poriticola TaxID=3120506 RepID=UPI002FCE53CF
MGAFADRGCHGTTTTEVAKAAGIPQAYACRLFPDKESHFVAVVTYCFTRVRQSLEEGWPAPRAVRPRRLPAMEDSCARLIRDRELLLVRMRAQAAAPSR